MGLDDERRELVRRYIPLAWSLSGRYVRRHNLGWNYDEFRAVAYVALCEAAARFDPVPGVNFATFAAVRIGGAMADHRRWLCNFPRGWQGDHPMVIFRGAGEFARQHAVRDRSGPVGGAMEHRDEVERLIRSLPARVRSVAELLHVEGLTQQEAAARLGLSEAYVSRLAAAAIETLTDLARRRVG